MEELIPLEARWYVASGAAALAVLLLLEMARTLPGQNIVLIFLALLGAEVGLDYYLANKYLRLELAIPLWWYLTGTGLVWMTLVLAGRRLAQLILRPWRRERAYGFWLLGASGIVVALFQFAWSGINGWVVEGEEVDLPKAGILAAVRGVTAIIFLACLFPWFIRKRPGLPDEASKLPQEPENKTQQNA
jgi:hypothetical protein